jgi:hypothetical protein
MARHVARREVIIATPVLSLVSAQTAEVAETAIRNEVLDPGILALVRLESGSSNGSGRPAHSLHRSA